METTMIEAEVRAERGKGPARRLRKDGILPGVIYGLDLQPTPLKLKPQTLEKALLGEFRRNTIFTVKFGSNEALAMVKDIAVDPVKRTPVHVDFVKITEKTVIDIVVPFKTLGRAAGVQAGGALTVSRRDLPLRTTPETIPAVIELDVTPLKMHESFEVKDLKLPDGVTVLLPETTTLAAVGEARRAAVEAASADEATEGAAPAEGDAAAPAEPAS